MKRQYFFIMGISLGGKEEMTDDFSNTTIEEIVPYFESLIGFVADKYFWTMYHIVPLTPTYIASKEALRFPSDIRKLYLSEVETKQEYRTDTLYDIERKLEYIESLSVILDRKKCQTLEIELLSYANFPTKHCSFVGILFLPHVVG